MEATAAPCLRFTLEDAEDPALPGCRYGGHPLVSPGTAWPRSPKNLMVFVGQLDFAQLAAVRGEALADLPRDGVLCLFYDVREQRWGSEPGDRDYFRLIWTPRSADARPLPPPSELEDAGLAFDLPVRMVPRLDTSLPAFGDERAAPPSGGFDDEAYVTLAGGEHAHQVGGHPWWIQYDARTEARAMVRDAPDWNLLWQVASDDTTGFMWGDMGSLYLLLRDADLRERRFERAWLGLQCG
ncbi:YwqG family protein [Myxococcaceae bacterium GXIMD 01537]